MRVGVESLRLPALVRAPSLAAYSFASHVCSECSSVFDAAEIHSCSSNTPVELVMQVIWGAGGRPEVLFSERITSDENAITNSIVVRMLTCADVC